MLPNVAASLLTPHALLAQELIGPRGYTISWGLVLLCVILGLVIALRPANRDDRVRVAKED